MSNRISGPLGSSFVPTETLVEAQARATILASRVKSLEEEKKSRTIVAIVLATAMFLSFFLSTFFILKYFDAVENVRMALVDERAGEGIPIVLARGPRTENEKRTRASLEIFANRCFQYTFSTFESRRLLCSSMVQRNLRAELLSQFFSDDDQKYPDNYRRLYGEKGAALISAVHVHFVRQDTAHIEYTLQEVVANGSKQTRTMLAEIDFSYHIGNVDRDLANMNAFGFLVSRVQIASRAVAETTRK